MKKVLSFVLVLSLVLSSFSMAFAGVGESTVKNLSDIAGTANEEAINVVNDLGIVTGYEDGTFKADKAVKRAEFAVMITKALGIPESALVGYTATEFTDVAGYEWAVPYLAFCESKGIMSGYGEGIVKPGNTITVNEAMAMALRAVGYTPNSAQLVGTWPANYVSLAQDADLYDDVKATTTVDRGSAAQIIYNTLSVGKVQVNADGETIKLGIYDADGSFIPTSMLTSGLNCYVKADEVVTSADYADTLIDVTKYIGAYGDKYYNDDDELVAFDVESTTLVGEMEDGDFVVGDKTYTFGAGVTTIGAVIANSSTSESAVAYSEGALVALEDASSVDLIINADVTGKTIKEIYSVVVWQVTDADMADEDIQEEIEDDNTILGVEFVEDNNGDIDVTQFNLLGVNSLKDIKEDHVVYVCEDANNKVRMVAVGTKTVEGKITKADGNDVFINGEWYAQSDAALAKGNTLSKGEISDEYKLYLDVYGDYFDFERIHGSVDTFAVITAVDGEDDFDDTKLKMFTSEDAKKTYTLADANDDIDYLMAGNDADYNAATFAAVVTKGALVGYELDANGNIETLDLGMIAAVNATLKSAKVMSVDGADYNVVPEVVVFTYDGANDGSDEYDIIKIDEVETGIELVSGCAVNVLLNEDDEVVAFLMSDASEFTSVDTDEVFGVFSGRVDMLDEDDEEIFEYTGIIGKDAKDYVTVEDDDMPALSATEPQLFRIELTADGAIDTMVLVSETASKAGEQDGIIVTGEAVDFAKSNTVITITGGAMYTVAEDAIVYECVLDADDEIDEYKVSNLSKIKKNYTVYLYDTDGEDCDMIADVVIFVEN